MLYPAHLPEYNVNVWGTLSHKINFKSISRVFAEALLEIEFEIHVMSVDCQCKKADKRQDENSIWSTSAGKKQKGVHTQHTDRRNNGPFESEQWCIILLH